MSFWTGFIAGVAASYAVSITATVCWLLWIRHSEHCDPSRADLDSALGHGLGDEGDGRPGTTPPHFTHVSNIGPVVHGGDG